MSSIRLSLLSVILGALIAPPALAQENAPTNGRSIASLAQVNLKGRDGARVKLGSLVRPNKPTLIAFWASWCVPCIAEAPYLNQIRKDLGGDYNFIYINRRDGDPDLNQPADTTSAFLARADMADVKYVAANVPAYRQIVGKDFSIIPEELVGIPRVYLFDRNGRQIYTAFGFRISEISGLEQRIKKATAE